MGKLAAIAKGLDWEFWVGAIVLTAALIAIALVPSQVLEPRFGSRSIAFSPKTFPIATLSIMAIAAASMAAAAAWRKGPSRHDMPEGPLRPGVLPAMAVMLAYVALLEPLGALVGSALAVGLLAYLFGSRWQTVLSLAILVPAFIWVAFKIALRVFLPEGILEGWV